MRNTQEHSKLFEQILEATNYIKHMSGHWLPISPVIELSRARHKKHCQGRRNKLKGDVFPCVLKHEQNIVDRSAKTIFSQFCADIGYPLEYLSGCMANMDGL